MATLVAIKTLHVIVSTLRVAKTGHFITQAIDFSGFRIDGQDLRLILGKRHVLEQGLDFIQLFLHCILIRHIGSISLGKAFVAMGGKDLASLTHSGVECVRFQESNMGTDGGQKSFYERFFQNIVGVIPSETGIGSAKEAFRVRGVVFNAHFALAHSVKFGSMVGLIFWTAQFGDQAGLESVVILAFGGWVGVEIIVNVPRQSR